MNENKFRVWDGEYMRYEIMDRVMTLANIIAFGHLVYPIRETGIWQRSVRIEDDNGKEIFEGDIVSFKYGGIRKGVIEYVIDRFLINSGIHYSIANNFDIKDIKVIGNICENPELLEDHNGETN